MLSNLPSNSIICRLNKPNVKLYLIPQKKTNKQQHSSLISRKSILVWKKEILIVQGHGSIMRHPFLHMLLNAGVHVYLWPFKPFIRKIFLWFPLTVIHPKSQLNSRSVLCFHNGHCRQYYALSCIQGTSNLLRNFIIRNDLISENRLGSGYASN